jgi:tetratricopeptide (TPR) repeat protein
LIPYWSKPDFDEALRLAPNSAAAHASIGRWLSRNELGIREAVAHFDQAVKLGANDPAMWCDRGELLVNAGGGETPGLKRIIDNEAAHAQALSDFNEALKLNPKYPRALLGRGKVYLMMGDKPKAAENFQALAQLYPQRWPEYEERIKYFVSHQVFGYREAPRLMADIFKSMHQEPKAKYNSYDEWKGQGEYWEGSDGRRYQVKPI